MHCAALPGFWILGRIAQCVENEGQILSFPNSLRGGMYGGILVFFLRNLLFSLII